MSTLVHVTCGRCGGPVASLNRPDVDADPFADTGFLPGVWGVLMTRRGKVNPRPNPKVELEHCGDRLVCSDGDRLTRAVSPLMGDGGVATVTLFGLRYAYERS